MIKLGLGVSKKIAPATWADNLSYFFVFNLFCKNGTAFLENKNIFQWELFKAIYNPKIKFEAQTIC